MYICVRNKYCICTFYIFGLSYEGFFSWVITHELKLAVFEIETELISETSVFNVTLTRLFDRQKQLQHLLTANVSRLNITCLVL
jgi:hypothetical protein